MPDATAEEMAEIAKLYSDYTGEEWIASLPPSDTRPEIENSAAEQTAEQDDDDIAAIIAALYLLDLI